MALAVMPFNAISVSKSLFPVSSDAYWFVTQYIGLLILSPFLAVLARQLTYRQYLALLIGGALICLSIIPDFPLGKRFYVAHGNSVWSFAYLFMIAGFIKHHLKKVPMGRLSMIVVSLIVLILVCEIIGGYKNGSISLYWLNYNGLVLILSVAVFVLVRQLQIPERGFLNLFVKAAPYTYGVYLIHDHLLVRDWLWNTVSLSSYGDRWLFPLIVIGTCLVIFVASAAVDAVRKKLFTVIGLDKFIARVDKWTF